MSTTFSLGKVVVTSAIHDLMSTDLSFHTFIYTSLMRHHQADWGELSAQDRKSNDHALVASLRIFSVYHCSPAHSVGGDRIYIITEADRSATSVMWPSEY